MILLFISFFLSTFLVYIKIDSNAITSIYAKNAAVSQLVNAIRKETNGAISLFYINKNKADVLLQSSGHQLPGNLFQNNGFVRSIREKEANVNTRFENVTRNATIQALVQRLDKQLQKGEQGCK